MSDDDTLAMLRALAKERGVPLDELVADLLRAKAEGRTKIQKRGERSTAMEIEEPEDRSRWTDAEVAERWLQEEMNDPDGVLGPGGMTPGGIFGDSPVVTEGYDPMARQRGEGRAVGMLNARVQAKILDTLERMDRRLDAAETERRLPAPRRELPRRRR